MIIQGGANNITTPGAGGVRRTYGTVNAGSVKTTEKSDFARRFDSVTISSAGGNMELGGIGMELKSRLTQEVRAAASTENVAALKELIQNGDYHPDATETAKKMLLFGEAG